MTLEIITLGLADTLEAEAFGANRVELVSNMSEGGLTPSDEVIMSVLSKTNIPVQIMVRPHGKSFVYSEADWQEMKESIEKIRAYGGRRIVIGAITETGEIDLHFLDKLMKIASDFDVTFHRAFDEVTDQLKAYRDLSEYKFIQRILTSGGKPTAGEGADNLRALVELSQTIDGPEILVGSGVSTENLVQLKKDIGAKEYHIGSAARINKDFDKGLDKEKIQTALNLIR